MARQKYPYDIGRARTILAENPDRTATAQLKEYVAGLYPKTPEMSEDEKEKRIVLINLTYGTMLARARDHGWVKPHHHGNVNASAWSKTKKEKFKEHFLKGTPAEDFTETRQDEELKEFWPDFAGITAYKVTFHNFARSIGVGSEDRLARKKAIDARKAAKKDGGGKQRKEKKVFELPKFSPRKFPNPQVIEISPEAWAKPGVRVGAMSRIDWKDKGARKALVQTAYERIFVPLGCNYLALNGGKISKYDIDSRIRTELAKHTKAMSGFSKDQKVMFTSAVVDHILEEVSSELNATIPIVKKPPLEGQPDQVDFVRLYVMTSRILDGYYGDRIARLLQAKRPDIRLYKMGGDRTRLKGVGRTEAEKREGGQEIQWLNPKKHRLPSKYASTAVDKEADEEDAAAESYTELTVVGGFGSSTSKPGGGEKKRARISLPNLSIPMPRRAGEPSIALNQIGVRVIHADPNGKEKLIQNWSLRDLARSERLYVTGIKEGASDLHKRIVDAIKKKRDGLHVGELSDALEGVSREEIETALQFLVEPKALERATWPGLYRDEESGRYNLHLDWLQDRLRYPWPYDKGVMELKRLIFGCLHAGYNTTDYEFVRQRFTEIIARFGIEVVELCGDITAGLKHHLIHRGQIIGSLNYTEQEILAAELLGTVFYEVFVKRFEAILEENKGKNPSAEELDEWVAAALILFLYIIGNHEAWQKELGFTPGRTFRTTLISLLDRHIGKFLEERGLFTPHLNEIVRNKIIELPEYNAKHTFPGGISTELLHPSMSRTLTTSIRAEEALGYSDCQLVDLANFHTTIMVEKWEPDLGQRVASQVGAMTPLTYFEHGKLKRVDFGPTYVGVRSKSGRIFMSEHMFFSEPLLREPLDKDTDVNTFKKRLNLLRAPV